MGEREGGKAKQLDCAVVIDASTFASSYHAFWSEAAPTLEHFVRRLNLGNLERFVVPIVGEKTYRRAIISEYAFSIFFENWIDHGNTKPAEQKSREAWEQMERRLTPFLGKGVSLSEPLSMAEEYEVNELVRRLSLFFRNELFPQEVRPVLRGCGFVDASEADVFADATLFEVKTVDRSFRSVDIRQLISYSALNYCSKQYDIQNIGLVNPRAGVFFEMTLESVSREISGTTSEELLSLVANTLSSGDISR